MSNASKPMNDPLPPPVSRLPPAPRGRLLLVLPALIEFLVDIAITLRGQPPEYWNGNVELALEVNPVGLHFLNMGPWAFVVGAVLYAALFSLAILWLPEIIAFWLSLALVVAHSSGTNSWLTYEYGSWVEGTHNSLIAVVAAVCFRSYFLRVRRAHDVEEMR